MAQLVKTVSGLAIASVKTVSGLAIASCKTIQGVDNTGGGQTLIHFEDFQSAASGQNNLTGITGWSALEGTISTTDLYTPEIIAYPNTSANYGGYLWGTGSASLDQRVEVTIHGVDSGAYEGPACRMQSGPSYYAVYVNSSAVSLQKRIAGSSTELDTDPTALADGDMVSIEVTGSGAATRITVQIDTGGGWTDLFTSVDPGDYLGSGKGGIAIYGQNSVIGIKDQTWYDV